MCVWSLIGFKRIMFLFVKVFHSPIQEHLDRLLFSKAACLTWRNVELFGFAC